MGKKQRETNLFFFPMRKHNLPHIHYDDVDIDTFNIIVVNDIGVSAAVAAATAAVSVYTDGFYFQSRSW